MQPPNRSQRTISQNEQIELNLAHYNHKKNNLEQELQRRLKKYIDALVKPALRQFQQQINKFVGNNKQMREQKIEIPFDNQYRMQEEVSFNEIPKEIQELKSEIQRVKLELNLQKDQNNGKYKQVSRNLFDLGGKTQIQENKLQQLIDVFAENKKNYQNLGNIIGEKPKISTDIIQSAINISKRCPFFHQYRFDGSKIIYQGVNKKATQLLSQNIIQLHQKTTFKLNIFQCQASCIKFGVIDRKYIGERTCWNYPHSVYYHGWGHTMVGGEQIQYPYGGFGAKDSIKMIVDLLNGVIVWHVFKKGVQIQENKCKDYIVQQKARILKNKQIQWVPFIAMYNTGDTVEWSKN